MLSYSHEVETMCTVAKGPKHGPAPIPEEGRWVKPYEIKDISGLSHGIGAHPSKVAANSPLTLRKVSFKRLSLKHSVVPV